MFVTVRQFEKQLCVGPVQQLICTFSDIKGAHCQQPIFLNNRLASHHAGQLVRCFQRDGVHMERRWRHARDRSTGHVFHTLECPFARCVRSALMSLDGILLQVSFSTIRRLEHVCFFLCDFTDGLFLSSSAVTDSWGVFALKCNNWETFVSIIKVCCFLRSD